MLFKIEEKRIRKVIVPEKLIYKREAYRILDIPKKFMINEFIIKTLDGEIDNVFVQTPHPNVNPKSKKLCLPNTMRSLKVTKNTIKMIENILTCFNLDNCYFTPWDEIQYRK
jgi:hypothetical protein